MRRVTSPYRPALFALLPALLLLLAPLPAGSSDFDVGLEKLIGAQVAAALRDNAGVDNDPLLAGWVARIGADVSRVSPRQNIPYSFTILGTDTANALAAPGGSIFVTRGLLDTIDSDDELAVILAHETGHVTKRHAMQQIGENLLVLGLLTTLKNDKYKNLRTAASLANVLRTLHKSREMEAQADELGLKFAFDAGYDAGGLVHFFDGFDLRGRSLLAEYFSTHPTPASRRKKALDSPYVTRQDLTLREQTARGLATRGLPTESAKVRQGLDPLILPAYTPPVIPDFLAEESKQIRAQSDTLLHRLDTAYKAEDIGATLKQVLLINSQGDARWLYVAARAYAVQARVEDIFSRTVRVAQVAPATYDALAPYALLPAGDTAGIDGSLGRGEVRRSMAKAEGAIVPISRAAASVTTVLADLNNRFLRTNNEAAWLRYSAMEALLRYAESELSRADARSGQAWRLLSLARIRRYQHQLNTMIPESDTAKRALWSDLAARRFGTWFPTTGPTGDASVRAALSIELGEAAFTVEKGRDTTSYADWVLEKKGVPENIATALRLLVFDLERQ